MKAPILSALLLGILATLTQGQIGKPPAGQQQITCQVPNIGTGDDSGPNIRAAFEKCKTNGKIIMDADYLVKTLIVTPALQNVEIQLTGTITYDDNLAYWSAPTTNPAGPGSYYMTYQNATTFFFLKGNNIHLYGTPGALKKGSSSFYGKGQLWWDAFAVNKNKGAAGGSSTTFARPILLTIGDSSNVLVENIGFIQGPFWSTFVINSQQVELNQIKISAVSHSQYPTANTDGIDIYRSDHVKLTGWNVNNGDDCVSLKPNSTNVEVGYMNCNGSHGISVGSLGQYKGEVDIVQNVYVHDIVMSNSQNGARIKIWPNSNAADGVSGGGSGFVKNVTFANFKNVNVDNPIILTTCYNYKSAYCATNPAVMTVSDVHYIGVTGTSSGKQESRVVTLDCSNTCTDITATGTSLKAPAIFGASTYECENIASKSQVGLLVQGDAADGWELNLHIVTPQLDFKCSA